MRGGGAICDALTVGNTKPGNSKLRSSKEGGIVPIFEIFEIVEIFCHEDKNEKSAPPLHSPMC